MKRTLLCACVVALAAQIHAASPYTDRFVFLFGWNLQNTNSMPEISRVLETAGKHSLNGALTSGFDTLCKQSPEGMQRLKDLQKECEKNGLELIPGVFPIGYGGGILTHDKNLAEGLPVENAPFVVNGTEAHLIPNTTVRIANGGFEEFSGNNLKQFGFHDLPGKVSFIDTNVFHSGKASLRFENFKADPYEHGRVMQQVSVQPHRCYRMTLWVKTEGLRPGNAFQVIALDAKEHNVAPRQFTQPATSDWHKISMLVNSLDSDKLNFYTGMWGGKEGKLWLDDWTLEEVGAVNVLRRPGTPVTVQNEDGSVTYTEGKDFAPLYDPNFSPWRDDGAATPLKLLPNSAIHDGQKLRVSWYHSMLVLDSQVVICMGEPAVYEIFDHESKLLAENFHPKRVLLSMDEIRMGGTCRACSGKNMAELLGQCATREMQSIHRYSPDAKVYIWSDMFDPNHNAHADYYLVKGDFTGSWKYVPKDLIMAVWGGEPRPDSLKFFSGEGFETMIACYYDANDLKDVKGWIDLASKTPKVRGFMYTPWEKKYSLLPEFGDLIGGK